MALIKCPECGKDVSDTIDQCIHCGFRLKKDFNQNKTKSLAEDFYGETKQADNHYDTRKIENTNMKEVNENRNPHDGYLKNANNINVSNQQDANDDYQSHFIARIFGFVFIILGVVDLVIGFFWWGGFILAFISFLIAFIIIYTSTHFLKKFHG